MALSILNEQPMKEMLALLDNSSPAKHEQAVADGFGATRMLGRIEGFQLYADMLRSLAEPLPSAVEDVQTSWGVELPNPNK